MEPDSGELDPNLSGPRVARLVANYFIAVRAFDDRARPEFKNFAPRRELQLWDCTKETLAPYFDAALYLANALAQASAFFYSHGKVFFDHQHANLSIDATRREQYF